ncbi:hypothetical protein T459_35373 [Capsicum annuum]|uniref:Anaphase-promoting complex subunit 5 n=1 Tax=Capsicum annuum TaxID=4072 RepID=A0A2G2XTG7_CAPAN|nr:hypothetical protein T459_35373 [Capsicum annuum]
MWGTDLSRLTKKLAKTEDSHMTYRSAHVKNGALTEMQSEWFSFSFLSREAFAALKLAEEKFLSLSKSQIQLVKLQLLHDHALHTGNLKLAQQLCDELGVLASSVAGVDIEIKVEASLRHARILIAANQFSQAAAVARSLFCMCYKFSLQVENATVLLLFAEIHKRSGNAVLGIPYALASLSFCKSFNLDLLKASATLTLAELWLSLGSSHAKRALDLIHGAFPVLLGHGGLELRARAFITEAKCYLADSNFSVSEEPEMVLEPLRQASEDLELLEAAGEAVSYPCLHPCYSFVVHAPLEALPSEIHVDIDLDIKAGKA